MLDINKDFTVHPKAKAPVWRCRGIYLHDVYEKYSDAKQYAYDYCRDLFCKYNGRDFAISSHNSMMFTVNFYFMHPETGELMFARITKDYNHAYYVR